MGLPLQTLSYYDLGGGLDLKSSPTKVAEADCTLGLNVDYSVDGAVATRNGSSIVNITTGIPAQISGAPTALAAFDYKRSNGTEVEVFVAGTTIYHDFSTPVAVVTGLTANLVPDMEFIVTNNNEYLVFGNGTDTNLKFDGTTWTNLSLPRPIASVASDNGAGTLGAGDYKYYVSFAVTVGGVIVQESQLSPVSNTLTLGASRQISITVPVCTETLLTGVTAQCNARVIYRISPTSVGVAYRQTTILDNTTTSYSDNTLANGTISADFNNQAAPNSAVFELNDYGQIIYVDASQKTDLYAAVAYEPWNVPVDSLVILDGPINCLKRCFGAVLSGTDKSIWVQDGNSTVDPRRISSYFGILNNRCAVGMGTLYIFATNNKFYTVSPTDFSQSEMRISEPYSVMIDPLISQITANSNSKICMEYYTKADVAKVVISCPISTSNNNRLIIYNETQSLIKGKPVWQYWDNINAAMLRQAKIDGEINLYSGDYNGFIWKLDDDTTYGDGSEDNGTVTSAGASTLTDSTATWTINEHVGKITRIIDGIGVDQFRTVVSNTATALTLDTAWTTSLNTTSKYTVGGYDAYHYTNWKSVLGSYDLLKQLWFIWVNANASGDYTISLILQFDFDQSTTNQETLNITLVADNAVWGSFIWGAAIWGAQAVFQDRFRKYSRFRTVRVGFMNREAGQPFQINGFSMSVQNKNLFFRSAA